MTILTMCSDYSRGYISGCQWSSHYWCITVDQCGADTDNADQFRTVQYTTCEQSALQGLTGEKGMRTNLLTMHDMYHMHNIFHIHNTYTFSIDLFCLQGKV